MFWFFSFPRETMRIFFFFCVLFQIMLQCRFLLYGHCNLKIDLFGWIFIAHFNNQETHNYAINIIYESTNFYHCLDISGRDDRNVHEFIFFVIISDWVRDETFMNHNSISPKKKTFFSMHINFRQKDKKIFEKCEFQMNFVRLPVTIYFYFTNELRPAHCLLTKWFFNRLFFYSFFKLMFNGKKPVQKQ